MRATSSLLRLAAVALLPALAACASDGPAWAVHHASFVPSATGLAGTQTWEFFSEAWASSGDPEYFVCTRAQLVTGVVVAALDGCDGCVASYDLLVEELESDCSDTLATDPAFQSPLTIAVGDVSGSLADLDPYPGRSLGWYISTDGASLDAYGYAYDEALDWSGDVGAPGWRTGQAYTLWPAFAWDLRE